MKNALETLEQQILDHVREGRELPGGWTTVDFDRRIALVPAQPGDAAARWEHSLTCISIGGEHGRFADFGTFSSEAGQAMMVRTVCAERRAEVMGWLRGLGWACINEDKSPAIKVDVWEHAGSDFSPEKVEP